VNNLLLLISNNHTLCFAIATLNFMTFLLNAMVPLLYFIVKFVNNFCLVECEGQVHLVHFLRLHNRCNSFSRELFAEKSFGLYDLFLMNATDRVGCIVVCPKRESNPRFLGHNEMP
jgi:hypothetical protein